MKIRSHTETFHIRISEVDQKGQIKIPALLNLMQEAALRQLIDYNLDHAFMKKTHQAVWVLMKQEVQLRQLPRQGSDISVTTFPTGFEKVFAYRDFYVHNAAGDLLASAATTWVLMDLKTRRLARIPKAIMDIEVPEGESLPKADFKILPLETVDREQSFRVDRFDLDFNGHLNNVLYIQWMLESLSDPWLQKGIPEHIRLHYKQESLLHDVILAQMQEVDARRLRFSLKRERDGGEVAAGEIQFSGNRP